MMQSFYKSSSLSPPAECTSRSRQAGDIVYRGMTIAAMLMLLGSLWVF
jgi:hypothetical protein